MARAGVMLSAPDGPVRVRVWPGAPGGAVLLAFHGWTDSADVFAPLARRLGPHALVAVDAPGHAGTPLRDGDYVVASHLTSALAVLDDVPHLLPGSAGSPVVAYGHSMGALTAARLAAVPDRVVAAVLEEPARTTRRAPAAVTRMRTWIAGLQGSTHADRVAWARVNHRGWPVAELGPWARSKADVDLACFDRRHDWGEPLPVLLADVHVPVLLIRGDPALGGIVSAVAARRSVAACPGGGAVLDLPAGHSPRREAPRVFAAALRAVLDAAVG